MTAQQFCKKALIHFYQILREGHNSPLVLAITEDEETLASGGCAFKISKKKLFLLSQ